MPNDIAGQNTGTPAAADPKAQGATPASTFDELKAQILARKDTMPKRLRQIAVYALDYPDELAFATVSSLAATLNSSPSALVRFSQFFGFEGFSSLQTLFRERLRDRRSDYEERMRVISDIRRQGDVQAAILAGFFSAAHRSLESAEEAVTPEKFKDAVQILAQAETIYLLAKRRSFPLTTYMAYAFGKLGVRSVLVGSPNGIDEELLAFAGPRDAAFAVSFAPYASETVAQARRIAERGVPLVALTDSPLSPLSDMARCCFEVVEADHAGFRLLSASMTLTMALTVAIADQRREMAPE